MFWVLFIICIIVGIIWGVIQTSANNNALNENISKQNSIVKSNNITISKQLEFRSIIPRWYWRFIVDEPQQSIHILNANNQMVSIPFSKLIGCEVFQDNEVTGGIKRAIVGGVLAGGAGAIVGANTAKQKVTSFAVVIYQDDLSNSQIPMVLIDTETNKNHADYINACAFASEVTASVKILLHRQENMTSAEGKSVATNKEANNKSKIEELKELKALFEANTITEAEFEELKKELLNRDSKE